jgi:hypothetical protein
MNPLPDTNAPFFPAQSVREAEPVDWTTPEVTLLEIESGTLATDGGLAEFEFTHS